MTHVLGRRESDGGYETAPSGRLGAYRARDGSPGAQVRIDLDGPHAGLVVGKRGYGKSYTLGVVAEELARAEGVVPVVADPMGVFPSLAECGAEVVAHPRVTADALAPRAWCDLLGLAPDSSAGALVWQAAAARSTLAGMREFVADADTKADRATRRSADNHLALAESWDVFDPDGLTAETLLASPAETGTSAGSVLDLSGLDSAAANAVLRAVAGDLYDHCVAGRPTRLPWLLVDEAHAFFGGVAAPALRTVVTRGRQPGLSLVAATQRPSALPAVAISQADLLLAHRLTSRADLDALGDARPTYLASFEDRLPDAPGEVLLVDDATESVHAVRVRERETPHGGGSPSATDR
ncbi:ATP-binding protein [Halorussus salinisoli]|uniref:ATP-binding protein n=1 Tax=Halorussus salinisoli TaxID=2558242 RepID=UPI0010C195A7|nr:ATP-binding protein [Halorussus salinisoli]